MDTYYARSANADGVLESAQHHMARASALCARFLAPIQYDDWGALLGSLHDFGKWSDAFQQVLNRKKFHVNHALPGGAAAYCLRKRKSSDLCLMAAVIASHHGMLQRFEQYDIPRVLSGEGERLDRENRELSLFGPAEYREAFRHWQSYFHVTPVRRMPDFSARENPVQSQMLFARILFSALIDADWSSSAEHFSPNYLPEHTGPQLDAPAALERLLDLRRAKQQTSTSASALNQMRDQLFDCCLEAGRLPPGLFTATAPTGLGKTLSLMAFALQHCICHNKRRVIIVLPYLSILEQNCKEYRQVIPDLLEIHSNVLRSPETAALAERWDAPCIVTTNVSFFQPLFSAEAGDCRHLHQFANSVIILDEAQVLPQELLDATLRTVKDLCTDYGCTVVFSTATQPSFQFRPNLAWTPREIAPNPPALFAATRRVQWTWRTDGSTSLEALAEELSSQGQCCVIVNLKRHAHALLDLLRERRDPQSLFCLSTDLCPAHRTQVLEEIRSRLLDGRPCLLVATQCIEAGVDLDFPAVYRALAPLDALIQAAGRCNRNGDSPKGQFTVFLPEGEDSQRYPSPAYRRAALCVRTLQARHPIDCSNLDHIAEYYQLLYEPSQGDKQKLRSAIEAEDYPEVERQYHMISSAGVQVIVPYAQRLSLFCSIRDQLDRGGLTTALLRQAKEITVSSYDRQSVAQWCTQLSFRAPRGGPPVATDYYLLGDPSFYDETQGLNFSHPSDGIF